MRHDVEPPARRAADHDLLHAELGALGEQRVEPGHHAFRAFGPEPLLAEEAPVHELLERVRLDDALGGGAPRGAVRRKSAGFRNRVEPSAGSLILHVRAVEPDAAAIGLGEARHNVANRATIKAEDTIEVERGVERGRRDALRHR